MLNWIECIKFKCWIRLLTLNVELNYQTNTELDYQTSERDNYPELSKESIQIFDTRKIYAIFSI